MKKQFMAFFLVALISEVITTWLQKFQADSRLGGGLYYADFGAMLLKRLLYWLVTFLLLSALWFLISRGTQKT